MDASLIPATPPALTFNQSVLVLRTSVNTTHEMRLLAPSLFDLLGYDARWTIDLEDRDRVLRIERGVALREEVIALLVRKGYECGELEN